METRKIGSLEASIVGLSCNNFGGHIDADATVPCCNGNPDPCCLHPDMKGCPSDGGAGD